jgi:hypothetical protein
MLYKILTNFPRQKPVYQQSFSADAWDDWRQIRRCGTAGSVSVMRLGQRGA